MKRLSSDKQKNINLHQIIRLYINLYISRILKLADTGLADAFWDIFDKKNIAVRPFLNRKLYKYNFRF